MFFNRAKQEVEEFSHEILDDALGLFEYTANRLEAAAAKAEAEREDLSYRVELLASQIDQRVKTKARAEIALKALKGIFGDGADNA